MAVLFRLPQTMTMYIKIHVTPIFMPLNREILLNSVWISLNLNVMTAIIDFFLFKNILANL